MTKVSINKTMNLSEHFTLAELTKTKSGIDNVPNEAQVENLKRAVPFHFMVIADY